MSKMRLIFLDSHNIILLNQQLFQITWYIQEATNYGQKMNLVRMMFLNVVFNQCGNLMTKDYKNQLAR